MASIAGAKDSSLRAIVPAPQTAGGGTAAAAAASAAAAATAAAYTHISAKLEGIEALISAFEVPATTDTQ